MGKDLQDEINIPTVRLVPLATRPRGDFSPEDIDSALQAAAGGNLQLAADLADDIMRDDRVRGVFVSARVLGMFALPLSWDPTEPAGFSKLAPVSELSKLLKWGLMLGVGFAQKLPNGALETWHPRWFRQDTNTRKWYVQTLTGEQEVDPNLWIIFTPYGALDPWFEGLWVSLAFPWIVKKFANYDRARASEVFGSAMIVATAEGLNQKQREKWLSDLKRLARSARLVIPEGCTLDLLEAQGQTWGIYKQAIEWAEQAMTIAIAGQIVTTEGQSGFSRGDIHEAIAQANIQFGADAFSDCLAAQYLPQVWGIRTQPVWDTTPPTRTQAAAESLQALGTAIRTVNEAVSSYGVQVDIVDIGKKFGLTLVAKPKESATIRIPFAPTDIARFTRTDEARVSVGLQPLTLPGGAPDPRGSLFLAELESTFQASPKEPAPPLALTAASRRTKGYDTASAITIDVESAPTEFRIFQAGANKTDKGTRYFTKESQKTVIESLGDRDVMCDLEHLSLDRESPNYDTDARAWFDLEIRNGELWAVNVRWLPDGARRIKEKLQRYISPAFWSDPKTSVIKSIINVALTSLPAMHHTEALIAANQGYAMKPEEMLAEILKALGLPPDATWDAVKAKLAGAAPTPEAESTPTVPPAVPAAASVTSDPMIATLAKGMSGLFGAVDKLSKRFDESDKERLLASRSFTPAEMAWLKNEPYDVVNRYIKANPGSPPAGQPTITSVTPTTNPHGLDQAALDCCKATGTPPEQFAKWQKEGN